MKIKTNYDLIQRIKESKNGRSLFSCLKPCLLGNAIGMSVVIPTMTFIKKENIISRIFFITCFCFVSDLAVAKCTQQSTENYTKQNANLDLEELLNQLDTIEVKTTLELLKDAKLNQTNYKIIFSDADIKTPRLKQYKYIDVPLSNGYEETILQEHVFGDEEYEISVNEPVKKKTFRLAKNNI